MKIKLRIKNVLVIKQRGGQQKEDSVNITGETTSHEMGQKKLASSHTEDEGQKVQEDLTAGLQTGYDT